MAGVIISGLVAACGTGLPTEPTSSQAKRVTTKPASTHAASTKPAGTTLASADIHKIKHVIIIMQENRSFDSYFGTYPGADGIPMSNGVPTVCVPNPAGGCDRPYHDTSDINGGGPHGECQRRR